MFSNIIELIKNSVTTIVGLTVGALGFGSGDIPNTQIANISDAVTPVVEEVIVVDGEEGAGEASALSVIDPFLENIPDILTTSEDGGTEYFDRTDVTPAIFTRPVTSVSVETISDSEQFTLSENFEVDRPINPIKSNKKIKTVDVSLILATDFDKFDPRLQIKEITEDDDSYYSKYQFISLAIKDKVWQEVIKEKNISVSKTTLGSQDLGDYLSEELGEVVDNEIVFLKEVQKIQIAKKAELDAQVTVLAEEEKKITVDYKTLIGKVLDVDNEEFNNYTPVKETVSIELPVKVVTDRPEAVVDNVTDSGMVDNEAPLVVIQGNNPALIQIGSSYADLGAKVTDNISNNLGVVTGGDVVDTSTKGSYFVTYTATDEAGNVATATREVIIYDYGTTPVIEEETEPVVEEVAESVIEEEITPVEETASTTEEEVVIEIIEPVVEEVTEPVIEEETPESVTESVEEETTPVEETVSTTEEEVVIEIIEPVVEEVTEPAEEESVAVADVISEVTDSVIEGSKKAGKKVKETKDTVVEVVSDTTTATIEQVSEAVESVAEEVSALIQKVHFMELIGNINSALQASIGSVGKSLQASISTVGEGTNVMTGSIGQFFNNISNGVVNNVDSVVEETTGTVKNISGRVVDSVNWGIEKTINGVTKVWQKVSFKKTVSQIDDNLTASVGDYNKVELLNDNDNVSQKEGLIHFICRKIIETPGVLINKVFGGGENLTSTVIDYDKSNNFSEKTKLSSIKVIFESVKDALSGSVSNLMNVFRNNRPE